MEMEMEMEMEIEIDGCASNAQHAPGEHASLVG